MAQSERLISKWQFISPLLDEALELPIEQREAWLESLGPEHQSVKPELARLLTAVESPGVTGTLERAGQSFDLGTGDLVGPYRLLRKLGAGGMAQVWLAERPHSSGQSPVAVKLPHSGIRNELFCERLERERAILDALRHPNIPHLLDAGATSQGQPYLVLEYVDGIRIDLYCQAQGLRLPQKLELFLQLLEAIAFAHHSLVLHRDLKPSNLLVTASGTAHVLDFGIAKLLDEGKAEQTDLTRFAGRVLTLDYAAPEQILDQPLTVATDIYSLGVVLYELLAEKRPYRLKRESLAALEEQILEANPRPPSEVIEDSKLRKAVKGDLDRVVLKALKKDPAERYASAEAFASDIARYLQKRPVLARPDRSLYRLSMFVRRRLAVLVTASILLATLVTSSVLIAWQAKKAFAEKKHAEDIKNLLISILFDAHAYRGVGKPLSAVDLLRQAQQRFTALPDKDAETSVPVLNIIGASLLSQQDIDAAERTFLRVQHLATSLRPSDPQRLRAELLTCWVLLFRGENEQAQARIEHLLAEMARHGTALPEDIAGAWRIQSQAAFESGDGKKAQLSARNALALAESRLGPFHNQSVLALVDICYAEQLAGLFRQAETTCHQALNRALRAYAQSASHPNVLKARMALAHMIVLTGREQPGLDMAESAIRDASSLFGPSCRIVGVDLAILAELQARCGRWQAAQETINRSQRVLKKILNDNSPAAKALLELSARVAARQPLPDAHLH